ncbi:hypothetical protein GGR58DRAFT_496274 [Xylaria digitata]|nr:hypothetical protein GGR58DRAFT_496274 [Xylaria digitata]
MSSSLAGVLPVVLSPEYYTSATIEMLLQSSEEPSATLNATFRINTLKNNPHASEIIRYLLQYGLDVNTDNGSLLSLAITLQDLDLLAYILAAKPSNATLKLVFRDAIRIHNSDYKHKVLSQLLDAASSADIGQDDLLVLGTEAALTCDSSLLELALQYGATVGANSICMAVTALNLPVLNRLLSRGISPEILKQPFELARSLDCRESDRFNIFESLLKAGHRSTAVDNALIEAVERNPTTLDIPTLLVRHKADINYEGGRVVLIAASTGNLELLELLLPCGPKQSTVDGAFMAALSSDQEPSTKRRVLEKLLPVGVSSQPKSEALTESLNKPLASANIPQLLLEHGASVAFNEACVFRSAFKVAPRQLVELLSQYITDGTTATLAFQHALRIDMEPAKRYWIYECLLSKSVDPVEISKALVNSLETDPFLSDIPRLLLRHGASVTWSDAQPLRLAITSGAVEVTKLLSGHISSPVTADFAFACARKSVLNAEVRYNIFHCLLSRNVSTSQLSDALIEATSRGQGDLGIIRLLLENGADACSDNCRCFALAAREGFDSVFRLLSEDAIVDTVFPTLLEELQEEEDILKWYRICLNVLGFTAQIGNQDLLFQVIRKFPRGTKLLGFVLDRGVSTSTTTLYPIHPTWDPEPCTPLLWCLFQRNLNVANEVILKLLERSNKEVLRYHTPQSGLSAVFGCLFDEYRIPVLRAIIDSPFYINKSTKELSSQPFFDLVRLQGEEPRIPNSVTSISPTLATILLDNFDAFSVLEDFGERDDGSLHLAALLAQPKFIQPLIESGHDVNFPSEQYDFLIPLAVVCREIGVKRPISGGDWHTRIRDTMRILAPLTDSSWRLGGKSILYYAIHSGFEITKALVDALQVYKDPKKNEKYLYLDPATEIYYSPTMYIELLLRTTEEEKLKLITCLNGHGLEMRYFRDTAPEIGDQPAGYRGLPPHLKALWREHEENKKREAGRRRQEEEEEAREAVREDRRMEQEFARREKRRAREVEWDQSEFARKQALQEAESRFKMRQVEEDARVDKSRRKARMRLDQEEMLTRMEQEQRIADQTMAQMKARNRLEIEHMENKAQLAMNRQHYLLQTQHAYALALSPHVNGMRQIEGPARRDAYVEEVD